MIKSLQGLRALGMIAIFLFHSGLLLKGTFPVTFFFMLSGFVLYYSYSNRIKSISIKENIIWIRNRMKKMYPIHLITFVMSIIIRWEWLCKFDMREIIIQSFLNISLLQSLSKNQTFPFNGLSWFLSTLFLLYVVAVPLIISINNAKKIKVFYFILLILILENIIIFINGSQNYELHLYTSPFFRIFDFIIGMLLARGFMESNKYEKDYKKYNVYEFVIVGIFATMYLITLFSDFKLEYGLSYYSPIFALGIYIIAHEKGIISKMLCNNILQKIAEFSFEFYMVHELILILFRRVFKHVTYHWLIKNIIIAIPALIISIVVSIVLNRYITNNIIIKSIHDRKKYQPI